jgi:hypothetical protein
MSLYWGAVLMYCHYPDLVLVLTFALDLLFDLLILYLYLFDRQASVGSLLDFSSLGLPVRHVATTGFLWCSLSPPYLIILVRVIRVCPNTGGGCKDQVCGGIMRENDFTSTSNCGIF